MLTSFSEWSWLLICFAFLLYPNGTADLSDSGMRRWFRGAGIQLVVTVAIVGVMFYLAKRGMVHTITAPWFILPVWLLSLGLIFHDWHKQKGVADA
jgi:hypothetical protein